MVSFWDAVKTTFTRDPREAGHISSPIRRRYRRSTASSVGQAKIGSATTRPTSKPATPCMPASTSHQGVIQLASQDLQQAPE